MAGIEILKYTESSTVKGGTVNNYNSQGNPMTFTIDEASFTPACSQAIVFFDAELTFKCNKNGLILYEKNWNKTLAEMEQGDCLFCTIQLITNNPSEKYYVITIKVV